MGDFKLPAEFTYDVGAKLSPLIIVQVLRNVLVRIPHYPERGGNVVIFEYGLIIVEQGELRFGRNVKLIRSARVLQIVNRRRKEHRKEFKVREPMGELGLNEQLVERDEYIAGVNVVVIGRIVLNISFTHATGPLSGGYNLV